MLGGAPLRGIVVEGESPPSQSSPIEGEEGGKNAPASRFFVAGPPQKKEGGGRFANRPYGCSIGGLRLAHSQVPDGFGADAGGVAGEVGEGDFFDFDDFYGVGVGAGGYGLLGGG